MLFDPEAIANKTRWLDAVLREPGLVERVVRRNIGEGARLERIPRTWEPGGGATLFRVDAGSARFLLKVKHESVWVESRLESEPDYLRIPSLENEHRILVGLRGAEWVPSVAFFDREDGFQFLALEGLKPFPAAAPRLGVDGLLRAWDGLVAAVRELHARGLVHTDVHEHNLCLRGGQIVLVDFEEARPLAQDLPFEQSLDAVGRNRYGDVGNFPPLDGAVPGRTCLERLHQVFRDLVAPQLRALIERCGFGQECPYNLDALQERDTRGYQSVRCGGLQVEGQRPAADRRLRLLGFLFGRLTRRIGPLSHLDLGCNLGAFCFRAARLPWVVSSIGVDAAPEYVEAARGLAFLEGAETVSFRRVLCGDGPLVPDVAGINVITMFSVYHHVARKDALLADIARIAPEWLVAEFATQDRFYPERGSLAAEIEHFRRTAAFARAETVAFSPDYGRPIVVFSRQPLDVMTRAGARIAVKSAHDLARGILRRARRGARRVATAARVRRPGSARTGGAAAGALGWLRAHARPDGGVRVHSGHEAGYQEVTGYLIPTLLAYGERDLARRAAAWLVNVQRPDGAFCDPDHGQPYVFDTGQALRGLLAAFDLEPGARAAARAAADFLVGRMDAEGAFPEAYSQLSYVPETIQLYVLPPLREAAAKLSEERYAAAAERALRFYLRHLRLLDLDATLTHFLAYEIEALIDLGRGDVAAAALDRLAALQRGDGAVRAIGGELWVCAPGLAQIAVCWLKTGRSAPAERALGWMEAHQEPSGGWRGGYGPGAWYFPDVEPTWVPKYYLDAHLLRLASYFDRNADQFPHVVRPDDGRLQAIVEATHAGDRVLESGCGKGRFLAGLRAAVPDLSCTGVDLSEVLLSHLPAGVTRLRGTIENLPCAESSFDVVFSVEAVEHSANAEAAVREMIRVARPGGRVLVVDKQRAHWGRLATPAWERWPDRDAVAAWLAAACDDVRVEEVGYDGQPADGLMLAWSGVKHGEAR